MLALGQRPACLLLRRALTRGNARPPLRRRGAMAAAAGGAAAAPPPPAPKAKKGAFSAEALYAYPEGTPPPTLVDIGANLGDDAFASDAEEVVARARAAGVRDIIITGTSLSKSAAALALASRLGAGVWATAGVHPHDASGWTPESAAQLAALAAHPKCVALGECGLDFNRNFSTPEAQEAALRAQLALAAALRKPLFLHCRDAAERMEALITEALPSLTAPAVMHCFTGSEAEVVRFVAMGLYVGFTGWACDEREGRAQALAEAIRAVPLDRLLIETDAPYLVPRSIAPARARPKRNEPCLLPHVAAAVAAARGMSVHDLAAATTANAERVFGLGRA